jgi:YVTN family beta-propeller protein
MSRALRRGALAAALLSLASAGPAAAAAPVTPAGWRVQPAGVEFGVSQGTAGLQGPLGAALSPDGSRLLTTSSGAAKIDSVDLFDLGAHQRTGSVPYNATTAPGQAAFYGVTWSPDGTRAWASGGGQQVIHSYSVQGGTLTPAADIPVPLASGAGFPAGLAYGHTPRGDRIYAASNLSGLGSLGNPAGHMVTVVDPSTNQVTGTIDLGAALEPLDVAFAHDGDKAYVTNWLGRSVSVIDTATETKVTDITLSPPNNPLRADHPSAIAANPERDEVYTANANSDTISVIDSSTDSLAATIDVALVPGGPKGAIPNGLAVSPDGSRLYVAEAGENAIAVVDLDSRSVAGFIPTAWYPAAVSVRDGGKQLVVTNTNASGAGPNPCGGLQPPAHAPACTGVDSDSQYAGSMIKGSVQLIDVPKGAQLKQLTKQVQSNNQVDAREREMPKKLSAIKHVIYVIRENRTYDQVFGDLPKGNGDPSLTLFKDDSAPNARSLVQRFGLFDNFYADAEVSADGHNWITQAGATDYVDKTWPINYSSGPRSSERGYDFEDVRPTQLFASEPLQGDPSIPRSGAAQTAGYLWDNAFSHGVTFRDYGEYTQTDCTATSAGNGNISHTTHLDTTRFPGYVDTAYPGYSTTCPDHTLREPEWEREFRGYVKNGDLPQLELVRLGNDHTAGTRAGSATPQSYVADNDAAIGRLVDVVSHSKYWASTAIFITEDDAQNGPDHVDAHRTLALAISPYTKRGATDSTHYDTSSMIATIEDLLHLPPMTITDARATRMWNDFTKKPDLTPYTAKSPTVVPYGDPNYPKNGAAAPMAAQAAKWDLADADAAPEDALNQSIWKAVKGAGSKMPAPRHTHIIGSVGAEPDSSGGLEAHNQVGKG